MFNAVQKLKVSTAAGYDVIKAGPVMYVAHLISAPLSYITILAFSSGVFPDMKIARVTVLKKGGDSNDLNNYRPISVVPVLSKVVEKIMHNRLNSFRSKVSILSSSQFGFQRGKNIRPLADKGKYSPDLRVVYLWTRCILGHKKNI